MQGIKRSINALKRFAKDRQNNCDNKKLLNILKNIFFWQDFKELIKILKPIHEAQIISESSKGHFRQIKQRWDAIRTHLEGNPQFTEFLRLFDARKTKQISVIHVLAWHLNPKN
jgi:hypothetical protein